MTLEAGGEILGVQGTCVSNLYIVCQQSENSSVFVPWDVEEMFTSELYYCTVDLSHLRIRIIFIISGEFEF